MCTRIDAIRYVVTNKFGYKKELEAKIHGFYRSFLITGLIYEPAGAPSFDDSEDLGIAREWIATPEAYKRARRLNLKPNADFQLPSNRDQNTPIKVKTRRSNRSLSKVLEDVIDNLGIL